MYAAGTLSQAPQADTANDGELEQDTEKFIEVRVLNLPVSEEIPEHYHKTHKMKTAYAE